MKIELILRRIAALSSLQLLVAAVGFSALFWYLTDKGEIYEIGMAASRARVAELQAKNQEYLKLLENKEQIVKDLEKSVVSFQEVIQVLPTELNEPELISLITSTAQKSEVVVESIKSQNQLEFDFYSAVPISIELQGKFPALVGFLFQISQNPRIVRMETVEIKREAGGAEKPTGLLTLSGQLLGYKYKPSSLTGASKEGTGGG